MPKTEIPSVRSSAGASLLLVPLLLCGIVMLPKPLRAQTSGDAMTREQALNRARLKAPNLVSARARVEEARGRVEGASVLFQSNPVVESTIGPRFSGQGRSTDADITVSQDFEAFGRRGARIAGAQAGVTRAMAAGQETARGLLRDVAAAFLRALAANERLRALTTADQVASDFLNTAEKRYQAGDVPVLDVNLARSGAARTRAEMRSGRAEMANALGELRTLLGMFPEEQFTPAGDLKGLAQYDSAALLSAAQDRPDIKVLESELRDAESDIRLGNTFRSPDLGVIGRYTRDQGDNIAEAGIRISIPIFSRGQELRATGSARAARIRAELQAAGTAIRNEIGTAVEVRRFRMEAAQELESGALPGLEENETLVRRGYEEGEVGLVELLLVRREILETRLAGVNALLDAALATIDLQFKAGVLK